MTTHNPNGMIIYRGPSALDGAPIVAIVTGIKSGSANEKTGAGLLQTWIIRADVSPIEAVNTGADASICGDCIHRGDIVDGRNVGRSCYVTVFQAPLSVYKAFQAGRYADVSNDPQAIASIGAGRGVRLGSYGDPAAIPLAVWQSLTSGAAFWTGYTHAWRQADPALAALCMASADSPADRFLAKAMGYRVFRVTGADSRADRDPRSEIVCPASAEAGYKTTCDACKACGGLGSRAKADVVISVHGPAAKVNAARARLVAA